ncbi:MAG TPA: hypothetical protein VL523_16135 [Terriglobia bacterium]|nr:hypothetical protein [Terriglobia bacterium]
MAYTLRILPAYVGQCATRRVPRGRVHLMVALADHFEPGIVPGDGMARAAHNEQERRLERWCRDYPEVVDRWRDCDGRAFCHTYFYPAEQYQKSLISRLAEHCRAGWGDIEIHLHHGVQTPDTEENTRRQLAQFRDALAAEGCTAYWEHSGPPRYAFVHGNYALANSAGGRYCGVDSEMQVLAETGCYADLTLPTGPFHPAQTAKINCLYECVLPLDRQAPHRRGINLRRGSAPRTFPLLIQGPLLFDFGRRTTFGLPRVEDGALTGATPPSLRRLRLWKRAGICVRGRPDWLFIKLHCHSMDPSPRNRDSMLGDPMRRFLEGLVGGARERGESLHFVSAREMVNIILAACDGRDGSPGEYRDYRLKRSRAADSAGKSDGVQAGSECAESRA